MSMGDFLARAHRPVNSFSPRGRHEVTTRRRIGVPQTKKGKNDKSQSAREGERKRARARERERVRESKTTET
jgi:hypothetical protein